MASHVSPCCSAEVHSHHVNGSIFAPKLYTCPRCGKEHDLDHKIASWCPLKTRLTQTFSGFTRENRSVQLPAALVGNSRDGNCSVCGRRHASNTVNKKLVCGRNRCIQRASIRIPLWAKVLSLVIAVALLWVIGLPETKWLLFLAGLTVKENSVSVERRDFLRKLWPFPKKQNGEESARREFFAKALMYALSLGLTWVAATQWALSFATPTSNPREIGEDYVNFDDWSIRKSGSDIIISDLSGTVNKSLKINSATVGSLAGVVTATAGVLSAETPLTTGKGGSGLAHGSWLVKGASYVIFIDGSTIKAVNGRTGAVDYSGTDAATVIQAAIDALSNGGLIFIKRGVYLIATGLVVSTFGIIIEGEDQGGTPGVCATMLQWSSGSAGTILTFQNCQGVGLSDITINGGDSSIATKGLVVTAVDYSTFERIWIQHITGPGIQLNAATGANVQYCSFRDLILGGVIGIEMNGASNGSDVCMCLFERILINYSGTGGIVLNNGDNNTFIRYQGIRNSGAGYGIVFSSASGYYARNNYFYSTSSTAHALTGTTDNWLFGYDQGNGEPDPVIESGATLYWVSSTKIVGLPRVPYCILGKTAPQSIANQTWTYLSWDTESADPENMHDNVTNNSRITIGRAGVYRISGCMYWDANVTGGRVLSIMKNGASELGGHTSPGLNIDTGGVKTTFNVPATLAAGDYVEIRVYTNGGADHIGTGSSFALIWESSA